MPRYAVAVVVDVRLWVRLQGNLHCGVSHAQPLPNAAHENVGNALVRPVQFAVSPGFCMEVYVRLVARRAPVPAAEKLIQMFALLGAIHAAWQLVPQIHRR